MSDAALLAATWADLPWFVLLSLAFFYIPGRALLSLAGVAVAGLDE